MSTYAMSTKHPVTGRWEDAIWMDDFYGPHNYGVKFPSGEVFDPRVTECETREYD